MENENKIPSGEVLDTELDTSQDYLATIAELKKNSVSKTEYDKLRQENKNLLQTLVEGGQIQQTEIKPEVDVNALRNELFGKENNLSNLEYVAKSLQLREALLDKGEPDCFLPVSLRHAPTLEEIQTAQKVADVFTECVEYADGNNEIFTQELQRRTIETMPMANRNARRR